MPETKQETKTESVASPLLKEEQAVVEKPKYSDDEITYFGRLRTKMQKAQTNRDQSHEEFNGMDYETYYYANERLANTYIAPKKNREDTNFQTGVVRQKLFALLAPITNLNLAGDISAFDREGLKIQAIGNAMEDVMLKTNELDNDEEKKNLRHYELLKQGTIFVEELWDEKRQKVKKMKGRWDGTLEQTWNTRIKKAFSRPTRKIIPGINVYLGDISKYDISEQPFIFTIDVVPYSEAEAMFGTWERWKNVPKKVVRTSESVNDVSKDWTLLETNEEYVEILRYQDKWNNEFAVVLNGVLMTPVGLPLPWGYDDYNIAQQNLEPIRSNFAYGKSLVSRLRNKSALLDEMIRLGILKTQKSLIPPKFNLTGRVISGRTFMPGKINHGIDPRMILNADDKEIQGVTQAEMAMIKEIKESVDNESVSPTFQGQEGQSNQTATEVIELQRQAKLMLGLTIFAISMLEWKLEWLRLQNILANWFKPEDSIVDEARGQLKDKYRQVSVDRPIEGEGMGRRIVVPSKEIPTPEAIMMAEDALTEQQGMPVRLTFLDPDEVCSSKVVWQIVVRPKEKTSSEMQKLMFRAFMQDAQLFGPMLDMDYLAEEFANTWQRDPTKVFKGKDQMEIDQMQAAATPVEEGGSPAAPGVVSPRVNLPTPEKAAGQEIKQQIQTQ
jgi:hypothetical protein